MQLVAGQRADADVFYQLTPSFLCLNWPLSGISHSC